MASSKEYLDFILEQLSGVDGITHKQMMGEYILYMNGRIIGGFMMTASWSSRPNQPRL